MRIPSGVTDQYIYFVAVDSSDFTSRETGLSSFTVYRSRDGGVAAAMTTPTINETDATNMPGVYELLLDEDMTIASGNDSEEMCFHITHAGMAPVTRTIEIYRPKITAGNTLDVTSTGAAGIDWGNVENASTSVDLSATAINLCDTVTTNTDMRGTDSALLASSAPTNFSDLAITATTGQVTVGTNNDKTGYSISGSITTLDGLENISAADVNAQCDTALSDIGLDHLISSALPTGWSTDVASGSVFDNIADDGTATFDRTTDSLQAIRDRGDTSWITGGGGGITDILNIQPVIPNDIDLANTATVRLGIMLTNAVDDLPSTAEITPGTIDIDRKAIGGTSWTSVVSGAACSESAGQIYYDEVFDSGTGYAEGDSIRITFKSQKITVSANDYEITDATGVMFQTSIRQTMRGTDSAALASDYTSARAGYLDNLNGHTAQTGDTYALANGANGFANIKTDTAAILTDTGTDGVVISSATANQIADAMLNRDMSAVSDTNARSPLNAMRFLRNKYSISGTTLTVTKEDDSTSAWTSTLTTDAAADPVTGSDPA